MDIRKRQAKGEPVTIYAVDEKVLIHKYGDWYSATVKEIKRTGTLVIEFTTKGGITKSNTIDFRDVLYNVRKI
jgi:hypothetical protein